jgi:hypothetical protein
MKLGIALTRKSSRNMVQGLVQLQGESGDRNDHTNNSPTQL